jgi:glycosyltransferase involved in cell wall biosynthesis
VQHLTIAFAQLGTDWQGGQALVVNAISALHKLSSARVKIYVLGDHSAQSTAYAHATGADGIVAYTPPARSSLSRITSAALIRLKSYNLTLEQALLGQGVQALVCESVVWQLGKIASIGWLWDFQHLHLPDFFDQTERARRERKFLQTMRLADRLLVTDSVERDARMFAPAYAAKLRLIRPLSAIDPAIYERDPRLVVQRFSLPQKFFYVPGQFWTHKNHRRLFQALRLLADRSVHPHVVLTGAPLDYRDPDHFPRLMRQVSEWRLTDQVHYLGTVERSWVFDLMRQTICVLNPSLFEGWGYAVDEAAGVGKRILASDIAAHRDQAVPACELFDPTSTEELADKLSSIWQNAQPGPDVELEAAARARMPARLDALGTSLFDVLREAVEERQTGRSPDLSERAS